MIKLMLHMMMTRLIQLLPLLLIFLSDGCIEPLSIDHPDSAPRLVVEGLVTDQPGPYQVRLLYTLGMDSTLKRPKYESGALVYINDTEGHVEPLTEISPGVYQTDLLSTFKGEVGKSYYLRIMTEKGKVYESEPQKMLHAGTIDDVTLKFEPQAVISNEVEWPVFDAFTIQIDSHGDQESNLFRWRWIGTYKFKTFPELNATGGLGGPTPDPEPCSGYIYPPLMQVAPCTCCICWATVYGRNAVVTDNRLVSDNTFKKVPIGQLPVTSLNFLEKYHLVVEQLSVSEEVYDFWRLVGIQQSSSGNIFVPNSIKIRGNMKCTSDPDEEVLGVFSVSAVVKHTLVIYPEDVPAPIPTQRVIPTDCRKLEFSTTTQPIFW